MGEWWGISELALIWFLVHERDTKMRMLLSVLLFFASITFSAFAAEVENTLVEFARVYARGETNTHPPIAVSANLKRKKGEPVLAFKFTNISSQPLEIYPSMLPWGNPHSITIAAFTVDGKRIPNFYPIADPFDTTKLTVKPGESLEGDYDLFNNVLENTFPRNRDVIVMWSYLLIIDAKKPMPIVTGVVVIPKSK